MNKSKFLKKSLAMVLAVMLVVAMIPLSASAAGTDSMTTDLAAITVDGSVVDVDGTVFKADITGASGKAAITVSGLYTGETAVLTKKNGTSVPLTSGSASDATLAEYNKKGNTYTIPLTLTSKDETKTAEYTIELTVVSDKTTTLVDTVSATKSLSATVKNSTRTIEVSVPVGYNNDGVLTIKTQDMATIGSPASQVTAGKEYTLANYEDGSTFVVTSQSGGNSATYTVKVTEASVLTSFKAGGVSAKIDNDEMEITATYPASVLAVPDDADKAPAQEFVTNFATAYGATVKYNTKAIKDGDKIDFTTGADPLAFPDDKEVVVTCNGVDATYIVKFTTEQASDNTISAAKIYGETATITGNKITATLPSGLADATSVDVVLTIAKGATIAGATTIVPDPDDDTKQLATITSTAATVKKGLVVTVKAENGVTKQYTVSAKVDGSVSEALITDLTLKKGSTTYTGTKSGSTFTFELPYLTTVADLKAMKVLAATNPLTQVVNASGTPVTDVNSLDSSIDFNDENTASTTIKVVSKADASISTTYNVVVKLKTAGTGKTMSGITITSAERTKDVTTDNTYTGVAGTEADKTTKKFDVSIAYSEFKNGTKLYLKNASVADGGVVFAWDSSSKKLTKLPDALNTEKVKEKATEITTLGSVTVGTPVTVKLVVLAEAAAKTALSTPDKTYADDAALKAVGTIYNLNIKNKAAQTGSTLSALSVAGTSLSLANGQITGTVPYGATIAATGEAVTEDNAQYITFTNSTLSTLGDGTKTFLSGGIKPGADKAADVSELTNAKLVFVRQTDGTVKVQSWYAGQTAVDIASLVVTAENGTNKATYPIGEIKYAAGNTEAAITNFRLANATATISGTTINVTVPYGTKLNALVPTFTTSTGATVKDSTGLTTIKSGESTLNFSNDVVLKVTSEDKSKTVSYTVKTTVASQFSDVKESAWYYNYVMEAAASGIVIGNGDGTFGPGRNVTRRDFALMLTRMLGVDTSAYTESAFKDVSDTDYAMAAIAYCKDNDIINGYEDGTFKPTNTISREEAAKMLATALNLKGTTTEKFKDDAKIGGWAKGYVYACKAANIFGGDDKGNFNPKSMITRAETAKIMIEGQKVK